jgi:hypothetical protein
MRRQPLLAAVLALLALAPAPAALAIPRPLPPEEARFADFAGALSREGDMSALVARVARTFVGRPYLANTLNEAKPVGAPSPDDAEPLVCRLDAFDCVTLVESSLAIARAVAADRPDWPGFQKELERLRYRDGRREGYASRLHYFSEWIADNERRGLLQDLTPSLGGVPDPRPIKFMSAHRGAYKKLANDQVYARIQQTEAALSRLPRHVIPKDRVASILPLLQSGDIIAFATDIDGLDVVHTGLVERLPNGAVHLLHAPEPGQQVTVSRKPLAEYIRVFKRHVGVMIARPLPPKP